MLSFKVRFSCWSPESRSGSLQRWPNLYMMFMPLCKASVPLCSICQAVFSVLWLVNVSTPCVTWAQQRWLSDERVTWCIVVFCFFSPLLRPLSNVWSHNPQRVTAFLSLGCQGGHWRLGYSCVLRKSTGHLLCILSEHSGNFISKARGSTIAATVEQTLNLIAGCSLLGPRASLRDVHSQFYGIILKVGAVSSRSPELRGGVTLNRFRLVQLVQFPICLFSSWLAFS